MAAIDFPLGHGDLFSAVSLFGRDEGTLQPVMYVVQAT